MELKTKVGVSNRHVHLTKEDYEKLYGTTKLTKLRDLNQIGQYAAYETITIKANDKTIENVRIIGPFRDYTQIEISASDARKLNICPPVRTSGDISGSEAITLIGPKGKIEKEEGCIIADRHVHITHEMEEKYNIKDGQSIMVKINSSKKGVIEAFAKISDDAYFELHLDIDDANAFLLNNKDEVELKF